MANAQNITINNTVIGTIEWMAKGCYNVALTLEFGFKNQTVGGGKEVAIAVLADMYARAVQNKPTYKINVDNTFDAAFFMSKLYQPCTAADGTAGDFNGWSEKNGIVTFCVYVDGENIETSKVYFA